MAARRRVDSALNGRVRARCCPELLDVREPGRLGEGDEGLVGEVLVVETQDGLGGEAGAVRGRRRAGDDLRLVRGPAPEERVGGPTPCPGRELVADLLLELLDGLDDLPLQLGPASRLGPRRRIPEGTQFPEQPIQVIGVLGGAVHPPGPGFRDEMGHVRHSVGMSSRSRDLRAECRGCGVKVQERSGAVYTFVQGPIVSGRTSILNDPGDGSRIVPGSRIFVNPKYDFEMGSGRLPVLKEILRMGVAVCW